MEETLDYANGDLQEQILGMTNGQGPDAVIEAVGLESHCATTAQSVICTVMARTVALERRYALTPAILACRPGGIISMPGAYAGHTGPIAMGALMQKGLTLKTGQTHMIFYLQPSLDQIECGEIDPSFIITHRVSLEYGLNAYKTFRDKRDGCIRALMRPNG